MAGNFCAERVCIYKLTCESSCCELTTSGCFHTRLTYPDYKAIKLSTHAGVSFAEDSDTEMPELAFPLHPSMCPMPLGSHPPQSKAVVALTWLNMFHTWTWGLRLCWGSPGWQQPGEPGKVLFGLLHLHISLSACPAFVSLCSFEVVHCAAFITEPDR